MIPSVEDILSDLKRGAISKDEAIKWLLEHIKSRNAEILDLASNPETAGVVLDPVEPTEEMISAYMIAQHRYCHEADQRGAVEYARKACAAGLIAALSIGRSNADASSTSEVGQPSTQAK